MNRRRFLWQSGLMAAAPFVGAAGRLTAAQHRLAREKALTDFGKALIRRVDFSRWTAEKSATRRR